MTMRQNRQEGARGMLHGMELELRYAHRKEGRNEAFTYTACHVAGLKASVVFYLSAWGSAERE